MCEYIYTHIYVSIYIHTYTYMHRVDPIETKIYRPNTGTRTRSVCCYLWWCWDVATPCSCVALRVPLMDL